MISFLGHSDCPTPSHLRILLSIVLLHENFIKYGNRPTCNIEGMLKDYNEELSMLSSSTRKICFLLLLESQRDENLTFVIPQKINPPSHTASNEASISFFFIEIDKEAYQTFLGNLRRYKNVNVMLLSCRTCYVYKNMQKAFASIS